MLNCSPSDTRFEQLGSCDDARRLFWPHHPSKPEYAAHIARRLDHIVKFGADTILGFVPPERIEVCGDNLRDDLMVEGFTPRQLALLTQISRSAVQEENILLFEAVTDFAAIVRKWYPKAITSEFAPDLEDQRRIHPHPHIDMSAISFPDGYFHMTVSGDVLEHVPDMDAAFRELARVTKPGGRMLATVPFALYDRSSIRRAHVQNGQTVHLLPPEYHGNPMRETEGSLVYEIPGWDVIDRLKAAGFRAAHFLYQTNYKAGILAGDTDGVFVLKAWK